MWNVAGTYNMLSQVPIALQHNKINYAMNLNQTQSSVSRVSVH